NFYDSFSELRFLDHFRHTVDAQRSVERSGRRRRSLNRPLRVNRVTVLITSPRQQAPDGFLVSHAQRPCLTIALIFCGIALSPVQVISSRTSASSKPKDIIQVRRSERRTAGGTGSGRVRLIVSDTWCGIESALC